MTGRPIAEITVQVRLAWWWRLVEPWLWLVAALAQCDLVSPDDAERFAERVARRAMEYRTSPGGTWRRFDE